MGVQGLLGLLEEAVHDVHISELRGKRVAVDGYCWLHKATYSCALELCTAEETDRFLGFCAAMLDMLQHFDIAPLVVLDGGPLPSKAGQEDIRRRRRDENQRKGREALAAGSREAAVAHFQRAVDVTPKMAAMFEDLLRRRGVPFIVAPFEADAQLAFLQTSGVVDFVLTEDSDMVPYGVTCVVFKMSRYGQGKVLRLDEALRTKAVAGLSHRALRQACILAGCDYLEGLAGMGLKTAVKTLCRYRDIDRAIRALRIEGTHRVPPNYSEAFRHAELTFCHQQVFDPARRAAVPLTPLPEGLSWADVESFLGPPVPDAIACDIADGRMDPITREYYPSFAPKGASPAPPRAPQLDRLRAVSSQRLSLPGVAVSRVNSSSGGCVNRSSSVALGSVKRDQGLLRYFTPLQQQHQQHQQHTAAGRQQDAGEGGRDILDFSPRRPVAVNPAVCKPFVSPVRSPQARTCAPPAVGGTPPKRGRVSETSGMLVHHSADTIVLSDDSLSEREAGDSASGRGDCGGVPDGATDSGTGRPKTLYRSSFLAHGRLTLPPRPLCARTSSLSLSGTVPSSLPSDGDGDGDGDGLLVSDISDASLSSNGTDAVPPAPSGARLPPPTSFHAALQLASRSVSASPPAPVATTAVRPAVLSPARPGPLISRFFVSQPAVPYPTSDPPSARPL